MKFSAVLAVFFPVALAIFQRDNPATYAGDEARRQCHLSVFEKYARNSMSRTFQRVGTAPRIEDWTNKNRFYHKPSNQYFVMSERDGHFFQRRYQLNSQGKEINSLDRKSTRLNSSHIPLSR